MQRKLLPIGLAGLACISLFGAIIQGARHLAARADVASYVAQPRQIKACVLISDATQDLDAGSTGLYDSNVTPYVFYAMDTANDLKPAGFSFVNPLAPSVINQTIYQRWFNKSAANGNRDRAFAANTSESTIFQVSQPVTKNMAAYWEENLDNLSATDLQQYDIVYLPIHSGRGGPGSKVQFTPLQRERLRHYVDAGGTVWMESTAGTQTFNGDTFFIGVNTGAVPGTGPDTIVAGHHPLVDYPNQITLQDVYNFSILTQMNNPQFTSLTTGGSARPLNTALLPIIQKNGVTTVWAGDYGAGHVVVSSAQIGSDLNNLLLSPNAQGTAGSSVAGTNDGAVSGTNLSGIPAADMKFAYNLASWLGSVPSPASNSRRTGSTQETVGSVLTTKWAPIPILPANPIESATVANVGSGATIYKGVTFWVDGNNWLHAYDINPARSLNNNSNPDDGIPDFIYGAPYDEIWNDKGGVLGNPGNVRASTPTIFSQYDPASGTLYEGAVVTTTDGITHFYQAFPKAGNVLSGSAQVLFPALSAQTSDMSPGLNPNGGNGTTPVPSAGLPYAQPSPKPAPAPAVSDGVLFTLVFANPKGTANELGWRIAAVDLLASVRNSKAVSVFDNGQPASNLVVLAPNASFNGGLPGYYLPTGNLTVGEVKSTESDAIDRVVYVPTAADNQATAPRSGVIHGAWFSTRNEPLTADPTDPNKQTYTPNGQRAHVPWYTTGANSSIPLLPVVHVVHHNASGGATTGVNTYYYPTDFDISYKPVAGGLNHAVRIVFHNTGLVGLFDDVQADYTVDWPGDTVGNAAGSNTPSALDMETISGFRRYNLFSPNAQQMLTETTGGVTLDSSDNLFFSETNLHDQSQNGAPLDDRIFSVHDQYTSQTTGTTAAGGNTAVVRRPTAQVKWMFEPLPPKQFDASFGSGMFNNYQSPARLKDSAGNPIFNFKAVGAPVVSNGTVYVVGLGWRSAQGPNSTAPADFTVMLALNENINASIQIGPLANPNANITLVQPSLLHPQNPITLSAADYTLERVLDAATNTYIGVVTFSNFQASTTDGDSFNTMLPIFVRTTSGNGQPVLQPLLNTQTGYGLLDNLQYYVAVPTGGGGVTATSGPTVAGNVLYFSGMTGNGNATMASIDLVKAQSAGGGVGANLGFVSQPQVPLLQSVNPANNGAPLAAAFASVSPPVGATNVVVATNAQGITGLDNGLILIADNHRLLEVDAAGNALWTMESTVSQSIVGGNLANTSGLGLKSIALANPMTAHRVALNSFLIVDSGNNRVVGTNRGGSVNFELHGFNDSMSLLRAGDPLTLNQPADVESYIDQYPNGYILANRDTGVTYNYAGGCIVTHYLIADSGNYRIIDVADIFDVNGNTVTLTGSDGSTAVGSKLLIFNSRSLGEQNLRYRYRTVQQVPFQGVSLILSTLSNVKQASQGGANGGVAFSGRDDTNFEGAGGSVIQLQHYPGVDGTGKPLGAGDVIAGANSIIVQNPDGSYRRQNISNPTWFKAFSAYDVTASTAVASQTPRYLLADANGCYILKIAPITLNGQTHIEYVADWMLTSDDYFYMTGRRLLATSIQKENLADISGRNLFEPRLLITNAYSGADSITAAFGGLISKQPTTGEVFEIKTSEYFTNTGKGFLGYRNPNDRRYQGVGTVGGGIGTGAITRMIPQESLIRDNGGNFIGIKRTIGSVGSGQTTYNIEMPKYAERPL